MQNDLSLFTLSKTHTIKDALALLERSGKRIVFVVDSKGILLGSVTDGDIRRALLKGNTMNTPLTRVFHKNPVSATLGTSATRLLSLMLSKDIWHVPLLDNRGRLSDVALLADLKRIPLSSPDITQKDVDVITQVLGTPYLSIGPKVKEFEENMAKFVGTRYAVAVNSGTSGLHLAVRALDIKDGDEIITTPFSFIASANCALFERAKPVFVDIDEKTLCIDPKRIEGAITKKTKAILPVHVFGHVCDMAAILRIAKKHKLAVIEDACEALGSEYKGKRAGSFGDVSVFGFYPNKQITTAEGGMIVTNNERIAKLCASMRNQGRDEMDSWLSHSRLGFNYRLSELPAALGSSQLSRIGSMIKKRARVAGYYQKALAHTADITLPVVLPSVRMSWFVYVVRLNPKKFSRKDRDTIMRELRSRGINCRDYFPPIHLEPFYKKMFGYKKGDFPVTERVAASTIALPFHNELPKRDVLYIAKTIKHIVSSFDS